MAADYALEIKPSLAAQKQAQSISSDHSAADFASRKDLRELDLVTIDGEDAKDFDDAIYCQRTSNGSFELTVAIADVSHYVTPDSDIDEDAAKRATSTYFPDTVLPMLPARLADDLCSLVPNVDRLAMVCQATIAHSGDVEHYEFFEAVIRSSQRITYNQAQDILNRNPTNSIENSLADLEMLCKVMERKRAKRGALSIDLPMKIPVMKKGKFVGIDIEYRLFTHRIVEECMLIANVCAADFLAKNKYPFLYRVHDKPQSQKKQRLSEVLRSNGLRFGNLSEKKDLQKVIDEINKFDGLTAEVLSMNVLRTLERATYTPDNIGHFGLGYKSYTHFTSPIRRYADLLVHRAIKDVIKNVSPEKGLYQKLKEIGMNCAERDMSSERAAMDFVSRQIGRNMQGNIGTIMAGVISGMSKGGMFISFEDGSEGMVRFRGMDDFYELNPTSTRVTGKRRRNTFFVGMTVSTRVIDVNVEDGKCLLELTNNR